MKSLRSSIAAINLQQRNFKLEPFLFFYFSVVSRTFAFPPCVVGGGSYPATSVQPYLYGTNILPPPPPHQHTHTHTFSDTKTLIVTLTLVIHKIHIRIQHTRNLGKSYALCHLCYNKSHRETDKDTPSKKQKQTN